MRQQINEWRRDNGDLTHRLHYNLTQESIIFDLGGFEGDWSNKISTMYNSNIYIFEPVLSFVGILNNRFKDNKKVNVYDIGLYSETKEDFISLEGDSSSHLIKNSTSSEKIKLKNIVEFIEEENISKVDLIKINIEGAEYDLVDKMLDSNIISMFDNLQIQFHKEVDGAIPRLLNIRERLQETHELTYCYDFTWENWKLKKKI